MTWLLLMQGFLLAILAGALSQGGRITPFHFTILLWLICAAGMLGSSLIVVGIWAAQKAIRILVEEYCNAYTGSEKPKHLPPITGGDLPQFLGLIPLYLPALCFLVWIGILVILR
jgi:hypothetical protein